MPPLPRLIACLAGVPDLAGVCFPRLSLMVTSVLSDEIDDGPFDGVLQGLVGLHLLDQPGRIGP